MTLRTHPCPLQSSQFLGGDVRTHTHTHTCHRLCVLSAPKAWQNDEGALWMEWLAPPGMTPVGRGHVGWILKDGLEFTGQRGRGTNLQK